MHGERFLRQYGVDQYILNFYCPRLKLAIEVDGDSHFMIGAEEQDKDRQEYIEAFGIQFLPALPAGGRFTNDDVYKNIDGVCQTVYNIIEEIKNVEGKISQGRFTNRPKAGASQRALTSNYGAKQGVWTAWPDKDFTFENNIVSNCNHVWVKNYFNTSKNYSIDTCILANNQRYKMTADSTGALIPGEYEIKENNVTKKGEVSLRFIENNVDQPLPIDYLHILPGSLGYDLGAGLFKHRKQ